MKAGDLVIVEKVPRGHGLDALVNQAGIVIPTPSIPHGGEYINVFINGKIMTMISRYVRLVESVSESR